MTIAVGTTNPIKIEAVKNVVLHVWSDTEIIGVSVPSGVSDQPMTDTEAIRGARQRAQLAREKRNADFGIGIEGSTVDTEHGMLITGWVVMLDRDGNEGLGSGGGFLLPEVVAKQLRQGRELGHITDELFHQTNAKQAQGMVGLMTNGLVSRTAGTERAVAYALARFLHPEFYEAKAAD